jgi:hypothetical protein
MPDVACCSSRGVVALVVAVGFPKEKTTNLNGIYQSESASRNVKSNARAILNSRSTPV